MQPTGNTLLVLIEGISTLVLRQLSTSILIPSQSQQHQRQTAMTTHTDQMNRLDAELVRQHEQNLPGILGIEVYIPKLYINQTELEQHMNVASGKYTIGLGQHNLSIPCGDIEDINSICLTVVTNLLQKYVLYISDFIDM